MEYKIETAHAGPFVTVLTVCGVLGDDAQQALRDHLGRAEHSSRKVVVDLTEAVVHDAWPFPLLADESRRFEARGGRLVVVGGDNPKIEPLVGDRALSGLEWFKSLGEAMVDLLGDLAKLGEWPPADTVAHQHEGARDEQ